MRQKQKAVALSAFIGVVTLLAGARLLTARAQEKGKAEPQPACKIFAVQAITAATQKAPGRALNANFELDAGKWVYSVLVVSAKTPPTSHTSSNCRALT